MMLRPFLFTLVFLTNLFAELRDCNCSAKIGALESSLNIESPKSVAPLSLDYIQSSITKKINIFSSNLDHTLSNYDANETNNSIEEAHTLHRVVNLYDKFFNDETYLSTTNRSYVRLKFGTELDAKEGLRYLKSFDVSLRLPKTEEALYLFITSKVDDEVENLSDEGQDGATSFGIKYMLNNLEIVNATLFGGFRGISNPFAKIRIHYPIAFKYLLFRPVQYVEYSRKDEFKEETQLYFDHRLKNKIDLVRLSLKRYTKTFLTGMNYSAQLSYISTLKHSVGYQIYTSVQGQTDVQSTIPANSQYNVTPKAGLYNYSSGVVWRQQFFKKYLFYELQPIVEFNQIYNYNVNYIFRAHLELYFGNI